MSIYRFKYETETASRWQQVLMSESFSHSFNLFFQTADLFRNKASVSGFCHFSLVLFMVLWQSPDTPFMSCFYVSARLRVRSSRALSCLHALFCVGAWCSDPGTHALRFGFVSGFGHSRSMFCLIVWACGSSSLGRALLSTCVVCVCGVARSSCSYRLCAFMLCLVLCGTQLVFFIGCVLSCCRVLCEHAAYEYYH